MLYVVNKKVGLEKIQKLFPGADILDVTSTSEKRYAQLLSPFYPHMDIPIPNSPGYYATCVEAVWQGLKVFNGYDVDIKTFSNCTMHGLKRTSRKYGRPLGHRFGVNSNTILNYFDARMLIYLPTYKYVLENIPAVKHVIEKIKERSENHVVILLDYNTNTDIRDITKPVSHAELVKLFIEGNYPQYSSELCPLTPEELKEKRKIEKSQRKEVIQLLSKEQQEITEMTLF